MTRIEFNKVSVDFPIATLRARSMKNKVLAHARSIGGQIVDPALSTSVVRALDDVSFSLKQGDRLGLVGHNGSGKTTLIRVLGEIYAPTTGYIHVEGDRIPMFDIGIGFDEEFTGYENIAIRGLIMGLTKQQIAEKVDGIAEFSELGPYLDLPMRTYSAGMSLRLMFSIATAMAGNIILMDEWIAVGDTDFKRKANEKLREITERAGILVIASHDHGLLRTMCNLVLHLEAGRVKAFGPIDDVLGPNN